MYPLSEQHRSELDKLTYYIRGCAFKVSKELGNGFLERVYENALAYEIARAGVDVQKQREIPVKYDGVIMGVYYPDLIVNNQVIIELKVVSKLTETHEAQCRHYLRATGLRVCQLMNFGAPKVEINRVVHGF